MLRHLPYIKIILIRYFVYKLYKIINLKRCIYVLFAVIFLKTFGGIFNRHDHASDKQQLFTNISDHRINVGPVLIFAEDANSILTRDIVTLLIHTRIKYHVHSNKKIFIGSNLIKLNYSVIVFENLDTYLYMDEINRRQLDRNCRKDSIGIIGFVRSTNNKTIRLFDDILIHIKNKIFLQNASINPASQILRLTRAGNIVPGILPGRNWTIFDYNHSTYEPIEWAQHNIGKIKLKYTTVLQDHGHLDGIQRIFFGSDLIFWLHRLLFLDALSYLSHGQISLSLNRTIAVDIDDIFSSDRGMRLNQKDVLTLIATQKYIANMVPGFRFNLGFSGGGFHNGTDEENLGDDFLLGNINEFNWFPHTWQHQSPHLYNNVTTLMDDMILNYKFAKKNGIPTDSSYAVSPYHSGIYPVHEILYTAWKQIWNIKVTSTEEYPHKNPERLHRGFKYRDIMVLPRQTLGLYSRNIFVYRYPGGREKLDESIEGGEVFQKIVYNPINIFMTHMPNYIGHRLALYTLKSVVKFLRCWTNLKLSSSPPLQLGKTYFRLYPEETDPVWGNPCDDPKHVKMWSYKEKCNSLPKFLIVGPQKTGTTALYTFLNLHPNLTSNLPTPSHYEEMQFFNNHNYLRGLDWYIKFFPKINLTTQYTFEKSATYFDDYIVPKRANALLPHAKILIILISPAKRAYSWYQNEKFNGNLIAQNYSFYQVITASDRAPNDLKHLRDRCLNPGKYAQHIEQWLTYYPPENLHIIDGAKFISNPFSIMNKLQRYLKLPVYDYSNNLRYDIKKGFYCQLISDNRNKCLGKSKGRQYPNMDKKSWKFLQRFYFHHNKILVKLFSKYKFRAIPKWLVRATKMINLK